MRQKDYIYNHAKKDVKRGKIIFRRGQLTPFVILALIIVGVIFIFMFRDQINNSVSGMIGGFSSQGFMKKCIEQGLREDINLLGKQGGYSDIEGVGNILFNGEKYAYLCYTSEKYLTCVVQQPLIKQNFENSLKKLAEPKAEACVEKLKEEYRKRGYSVKSDISKAEVELNPGAVEIVFDSSLSATKGDVTEKFEKLEIKLESEMYDLLYIAKSIIDFESTFGDSETTLYMQYYPDLKIEKTKLSEGTTIYKVSNVITKEEFRFASRSLAWSE